ncbi:uncharacterized protein LOC128208164 [Mya arenaria]|uniref:uncharacterized protein LOC128208164 n=1 Tax=Mya arenaria TaxID=6604 RepID=UPI0022E5B5A0|nr:uncharacterized protein LOC128208164 [Mya arenaria]
MNPKSYARYGKNYATGSNRLDNEMRSWSRNKMEDRKLEMRQAEVDKHKTGRRKSSDAEARLVCRDLEENINKTTPGVDAYLGKSQNRYNAWRRKEMEQLDRKYRSMHKEYLKEYHALHLNDYEELEREKRLRTSASESQLNIHPAEMDSYDATDSVDAPGVSQVEVQILKGGSAEELTSGLNEMTLRSDVEKTEALGMYLGSRRRSTGSITAEDMSRMKPFQIKLTSVEETPSCENGHGAESSDVLATEKDNETDSGQPKITKDTEKTVNLSMRPINKESGNPKAKPKKDAKISKRRSSDAFGAKKANVGLELPKRLSRRSSLATRQLPLTL